MSRPDWAATLIELGRRRGDVPIYGSEEWLALPNTDPRKFAAAVRAAEAWREDGEPDVIRARLQQEFADADVLLRYRLSAASRDVAAAFNADRSEAG